MFESHWLRNKSYDQATVVKVRALLSSDQLTVVEKTRVVYLWAMFERAEFLRKKNYRAYLKYGKTLNHHIDLHNLRNDLERIEGTR